MIKNKFFQKNILLEFRKRRLRKKIVMKKILILGGAGFIGFNLVNIFKKENYIVTIADNLSRGQMDDHLVNLLK